MKIVDTFIFYNELELLRIRLDMLYDVVDHFILVEGDETFKGVSKLLYYTENINLFKKYNDKIIVIKNNSLEYKNIKPSIEANNYERENYSRDIIKDVLIKLNLNDDDVVLHSDLDEIPNPFFIKLLRDNSYNYTWASIPIDLYYYNFETFDNNTVWYGTCVIKYKYLDHSISYYRNTRCQHKWNIKVPLCHPSVFGWHFSFFGDYDFIQSKLLAFSEPTHYSESVIKNKSNLYNLISNKKLWFSDKKLEYVNFEENKNLLKTPAIIEYHNKLKSII